MAIREMFDEVLLHTQNSFGVMLNLILSGNCDGLYMSMKCGWR